jgi:hypothetical protein
VATYCVMDGRVSGAWRKPAPLRHLSMGGALKTRNGKSDIPGWMAWDGRLSSVPGNREAGGAE